MVPGSFKAGSGHKFTQLNADRGHGDLSPKHDQFSAGLKHGVLSP